MLPLFYQKTPSNVSKTPLMETIRSSRQISITARTITTEWKLNRRTGGRWWRLTNRTHIFIATEAGNQWEENIREAPDMRLQPWHGPIKQARRGHGTAKKAGLNIRKVQFNEQILIQYQNIPWLKSSCPGLSLVSADTDLSLGFNCIWVKWILRCWINP